MTLDQVGKILSGPRKPPVTKNKQQNCNRTEVGKASPVRPGAFEKQSPIISDEGRKGIEVDKRTKALWHNRLRINNWSQIHPGHQKQTYPLRNVAKKNSQRRD